MGISLEEFEIQKNNYQREVPSIKILITLKNNETHELRITAKWYVAHSFCREVNSRAYCRAEEVSTIHDLKKNFFSSLETIKFVNINNQLLINVSSINKIEVIDETSLVKISPQVKLDTMGPVTNVIVNINNKYRINQPITPYR